MEHHSAACGRGVGARMRCRADGQIRLSARPCYPNASRVRAVADRGQGRQRPRKHRGAARFGIYYNELLTLYFRE
jgi:hypothetical protein